MTPPRSTLDAATPAKSRRPDEGRATAALAALRPFALFRDANEASLSQLANECERLTLRDGSPLWRMGDPSTSMHFLVRGLVQIVKRLPNGDEASLGLFGPSECVGILAALGPAGSYPADAVAASDTVELLRLPTATVRAVMRDDAGVARAANAVLVAHAQLLRAKIDVLTAGDVQQRLATLLRHLGERFGDDVGDGAVMIPVALSRRTLARLVGAREETVIRVMTRWERAAVVCTTDAGFVVHDDAALGTIIEGD